MHRRREQGRRRSFGLVYRSVFLVYVYPCRSLVNYYCRTYHYGCGSDGHPRQAAAQGRTNRKRIRLLLPDLLRHRGHCKTQHLSAISAMGEMFHHLSSFSLRKAMFRKGSQYILVWMRLGQLASRKFSLQRIGLRLIHSFDSFLLTYGTIPLAFLASNLQPHSH